MTDIMELENESLMPASIPASEGLADSQEVQKESIKAHQTAVQYNF